VAAFVAPISRELAEESVIAQASRPALSGIGSAGSQVGSKAGGVDATSTAELELGATFA